MRKLLENKKGIALNQAFGAILVLVLIGVLVIIGLFIFVNLGNSFDSTNSISILDEDLTAVGDTPQFVSQSESTNSTNCNFGSFAVSSVVNTTGATVIDSGNYTIADNGLISVSSTVDANVNGTDWTLNYTANHGGEACTASDSMITQFGTYPVLIGLIGTIIFLGLVIGVLVASFVFGRRDGV